MLQQSELIVVITVIAAKERGDEPAVVAMEIPGESTAVEIPSAATAVEIATSEVAAVTEMTATAAKMTAPHAAVAAATAGAFGEGVMGY